MRQVIFLLKRIPSALTSEALIGSPFSFKLVSKIFNIKQTHPVIFETAIICATVGIMCPAMSFIASIIYYPYYSGFNLFSFWIFKREIKL